jgi:putative membrane protein
MLTILHLAALVVTVLATARFLPAIRIRGVGNAIIVAIVFSVLNFLLGWLIHVILFVPALLTLGLLFFFIPLIVNTVMLWLTDKLIDAFDIQTAGALFTLATAITVVNWLFYAAASGRRLAHF